MPELSDLLMSPNAGTFAAWALIGDERPRPEDADEQHFIRLVDKATVMAALVSGAISITSLVLLEL
jgi:hypothetical protein